MTPQDYRAALARLDLTHAEAAELLRVHPVTSRKGAVNGTAAALLKLIEYVGVKRARRVLSAPAPS